MNQTAQPVNVTGLKRQEVQVVAHLDPEGAPKDPADRYQPEPGATAMKHRIREAVEAQHSTTSASTQADEALRRVTAAQIGPRRPGVIYRNVDGLFLVVDVQTDPEKARRMLNRRSARFAVVVINLLDDRMHIVGSTWTTSDHVVHVPGAVTV